MYAQEIKVPKERVAVIIGKKGSTKRKIEKKTGTILEINSKEGDILIHSEDSVKALTTKSIIQAISRGFNPERALQLLEEDYVMDTINMKDYARDTKADIQRIKARIIGTKGKARAQIELLTKTDISIYGKTVCIIGEFNRVMIAKQAIENLLKGAPHGNVYSFIERQNKTIL